MKESSTGTKTMAPSPLRCPSCDHGNPAGAKFCNNCGLPVHLQPCSNCEAINDRTANRCYKCGSPLSLSLVPVLQPEPAIAAADTSPSSPSADRTIVDLRTPVPELAEESRPHYCGAAVAEDGVAIAGTKHTLTTDETLTASAQRPAQEEFAVPAADLDSESVQAIVAKRRRPGLRLAVAAAMLVALTVPAYLAYEDPTWFRERPDAITPGFDGSSDVQLTPSPQGVPVDNPVSQQRETEPLLPSPQDPAMGSRALPAETTPTSQSPPADANRETQSPAASTAGEPPLPSANTAGESKLSSPETRATPRPRAAKNGRQSAVRSTTSRSKQSNVARTAVSPKASDARIRAKSSDALRSEPRERAATRRGATRPGRLPAAAERSPIDATSGARSTETTR